MQQLCHFMQLRWPIHAYFGAVVDNDKDTMHMYEIESTGRLVV